MINSTSAIVKKLRESRILNEREDYKQMSTEDLITSAQSGDQLAFNTLVDQHQDFLNKMTNKYFLNTGDKEDLMQIVSLAFWDAVKSWDHNGDFEAYAGMLIKRRITDEIRKEETGKSTFNQDADSLDRNVTDTSGDGDKTLGDVTPSSDASPEDQFIANDGVQRIMDFIENDLSENERKALKMYIDGYKVSEISDKTGIKYKSVENALRRSKEKLAEYLREMDESKLLEGSIFTEKEISVLKDIFQKLGESKSLKESKSIEDMSQGEIEDALYEIEYRANEIGQEIGEVTDLDQYNELLSTSKDLLHELTQYEEYIEDDSILDFYNTLWSRVSSLEDLPAENLKSVDPYEYNGVRRSDFY